MKKLYERKFTELFNRYFIEVDRKDIEMDVDCEIYPDNKDKLTCTVDTLQFKQGTEHTLENNLDSSGQITEIDIGITSKDLTKQMKAIVENINDYYKKIKVAKKK